MSAQTTPLAKAITTLEGQLAVVISLVVAVGAGIDPKTLPPKWAAIVSSVLAVALIIQRGFVKTSVAKSSALIVTAALPSDSAEFSSVPS